MKYEDDTLKNRILFDISYFFYKQGDSVKFRRWNNYTTNLSYKLSDSSKVAESYWDLASYFYHNNNYDSSYYYYYKAHIFYLTDGNEFQSARMLLNLANIQKNVKDYVGSEVTTVAAIKKLYPLNKYEQLYSAYNNLGIVTNELMDYDKALEFHNQALEYENQFKDEILKATSYNNIGVVYRNKNEFEKSLYYFKKAISLDSVYNKNPRLYAMLLDNIAYSKLKLNDTLDVKSKLFRALKIRDSIQHISGIIANHLHTADFYLFKKDTIKALKYISLAKNLSAEYHSYGDLMQSFLFLANLEMDNANNYYRQYIELSDSLQLEERAVRNKFARVRFETDQYILDNKDLSEKNKNMLWLLFGILLMFTSIFIIRNQRIKFDKLKLLNQQQLANEEIYNLLLVSQNKLEEGREKEKRRISKELHDGILSKFFGIRLNLEILNEAKDIKSVEERKDYIQELKNIEAEIRDVSHQLNEDMPSLNNNFIPILTELFKTQSKISNFQFNLDIDEAIVWEEISNTIKINIYRIVQESIHNINKYSKANLVQLSLAVKNFNLKLEITDNGVGFDLESKSDGIGLSNMKSRIGDLSGKIKFFSNNSGTIIKMEIPIKNI